MRFVTNALAKTSNRKKKYFSSTDMVLCRCMFFLLVLIGEKKNQNWPLIVLKYYTNSCNVAFFFLLPMLRQVFNFLQSYS